MNKEYAKYLLKKTREGYNLISEDFSKSRTQKIWEELEPLNQYVFNNDRVLDLGCGNGRLLEILKDKKIDYTGIDSSKKLIEIAQKKYLHPRCARIKFQTADALNLPFSNNYFDKIYSIAVLHHIPSKEFQFQFLKEIERILKPKGFLILTVWNLWQKKKIWNLIFKYTFLKLIGQSKLDFKDIFYPWKNQENRTKVMRYFHCFTKKELAALFQKTGFKIKEIGLLKHKSRSNLYLIAYKKNYQL